MKKFLAITSVIVLAIVLATMLMACSPSVDSLKKKYEDKGYTVLDLSADDADTEAEVKYVFGANKGIETVTVVCFANGDDAKKYYEEAKEGIEKLGSVGEAMDVKKSGNAVAVGTKEAVAIF